MNLQIAICLELLSSPVTRAIRQAAVIVGGSLALAPSAKVQVPFWPGPATLQTLVVLTIGYVFGSRLGVTTVSPILPKGLPDLRSSRGFWPFPPIFSGPPAVTLWIDPGRLFAGWAAGRRRPHP